MHPSFWERLVFVTKSSDVLRRRRPSLPLKPFLSFFQKKVFRFPASADVLRIYWLRFVASFDEQPDLEDLRSRDVYDERVLRKRFCFLLFFIVLRSVSLSLLFGKAVTTSSARIWRATHIVL